MNASAYLADLVILSKVVEYNKGFVQGEVKGLATSLENIFHAAIVEYSKDHLASSYLNKFGVGF